MIDNNISELFKLSATTEKQLWEFAIIVFDSSALLNFYDIPKETRAKIYDTFEGRLKDRLMLPGHVQLEYLKNRKKTIYAPFENNTKNVNYSTIQKTFFNKIHSENKNIKNAIGEIKKLIMEISNATKKPDRHPHLNEDLFSALNESMKEFEENYKKFNKNTIEFKKDIKREIDDIKGEIEELENDDDVLNALYQYFKLEKDYSFSEKNKLGKEAEIRYNLTIPPGYMDKEKEGHQKYGDYYIWNQILEYGKKHKKSVILICDDITKNDWCIPDKQNTGRIAYPRPELSKEFFEETGYKFWMYSLNEWPYYSNKYLETNLKQEYFKTDYSDIDQSVVNPRDIALETMKGIERDEIGEEINPLILKIILENLEDYSIEIINKLKNTITLKLAKLDRKKRLLKAQIDFSNEAKDREIYNEELNNLYPEISDLEDSLAALSFYINENYILF